MKTLIRSLVVGLAMTVSAHASDVHWQRHFGGGESGPSAYSASPLRSLNSSQAPAAKGEEEHPVAPVSGPVPVRKTKEGLYVVEYHQDPLPAEPEGGPYTGIVPPASVTPRAARQPACTPVDAHAAPVRPIAPCETIHLDPDAYHIYGY